MKQTHKKYLMIAGISLASVLALVIFWKLLVNFNIIHLNQLAPKSYTRSGGGTYSVALVFLVPLLATITLLLGLSWKRN
ncbi:MULTISPECIES: hypothetical protein [Enterococcus]|uniref:Uncharacterized protein n=1 Tax=Enterococcus alcedinis TaxID=1274384 RepID=A0A917N658_9ENTE|nr:hypothetical protein [Enterococcus alcedinis]MBP2101889.1 hypothetical protein [Enterococcus alcedinis]GGI65452.1 hypothetical protein GCM10011482_11060 [Enterococcus alcedinis]